jgi:hypothetical protein
MTCQHTGHALESGPVPTEAAWRCAVRDCRHTRPTRQCQCEKCQRLFCERHVKPGPRTEWLDAPIDLCGECGQ